MKNMFFLVLAVLFFALAFYIYWVVAQENAITATRSARGISPQSIAPPSALMGFVQQWQPILTLLSSLGGMASFFYQVRVWMRGRG